MQHADEYLALKGYVDDLGYDEMAEQLAKTTEASGIISCIRSGDAVAIACAVREGISMDMSDANGLTPLHHAAARDSGLIGRALLERPNAAPWMRDRFGRLPLDIARSVGAADLARQLERVTYPEIFRDEVDGPLKPDLVRRHAEKYAQLGSPGTQTRAIAPERSSSPSSARHQKLSKDRER